VPKLAPSFAAKVFLEKSDFSLYFISDSAKDWVLFRQGGESTLTALITKWQKGIRNDGIRLRFRLRKILMRAGLLN
jgi:hypothetical protein